MGWTGEYLYWNKSAEYTNDSKYKVIHSLISAEVHRRERRENSWF
jgi:hypothetical protein